MAVVQAQVGDENEGGEDDDARAEEDNAAGDPNREYQYLGVHEEAQADDAQALGLATEEQAAELGDALHRSPPGALLCLLCKQALRELRVDRCDCASCHHTRHLSPQSPTTQSTVGLMSRHDCCHVSSIAYIGEWMPLF